MEILLKYLKYNCYCIRHYNVQLEYKTWFLCSLNMASISWSQMKDHLKNKLGYFMSSPRVERIILSSTTFPVSEPALELSLGSHISSPLRPSNEKVPIPSSRFATSGSGQSMELLLPRYQLLAYKCVFASNWSHKNEFWDFCENHQEEVLSFPLNLYLWICVLEPERQD